MLRKSIVKRILPTILAAIAVLGLAACGGSGQGGKAAPDLQAYYDSFMSSLPEDSRPAMMDTAEDKEYVEAFYPGLSAYEFKQSVLQMSAISATAYEFALVECADENDVEAVRGILQARIDNQINGGAFYPQATETWQKADLIVKDNIVALIVAGENQSKAVGDFNKLL